MMRTKYVLLALALVALILQSHPGWAVPNKESEVRWEGAIEPQASRIILRNLSGRPAEASLGSTAVAIAADGVAEIPAAGLGTDPLRLRSDAHLLVLQAPDGLDAGSLEIDGSAVGRLEQTRGQRQLRLAAWVHGLIAGGASVRHGATGAVQVASDDSGALVEVAVELLAPHTAVRIRQLDPLGNEVTSLVASASRPLRWKILLGPVGGESRIELRTLRGEAKGTAAVVEDANSPIKRSPIVAASTAGGGLALYDPKINWQYSPPLYYRISSAPPNICGDSWVSRNGGPWTVTRSWVCTDANGKATKGPWYYSNWSASEETYAYIVWSNGLSTNTDRHIFDKDWPTASITSPSSLPAPTSFSGNATDPLYNAGFSPSWGSFCVTWFKDTTTGSYWYSGAGGYSTSLDLTVGCTITGMPSRYVQWRSNEVPPGYAHVSGHCYEWGVQVFEASRSYSGKYGQATRTFCVP